MNRYQKHVRPPLLFGALLVAALACNLNWETATNIPQPPAVPGAESISNLEDVKQAVVQIEAQGTFIDPEVGLQVNLAGRGSGFIIDPSGLAVTNNHVVTGAALLKVWVGGESEPRNARVLGVSECSDLAVIDIEGEGYPFLGWYEGPIEVGLEVHSAGYPLGDPEYTLSTGIVSKASANGDTDWASLDSVLEHDATINPGNSGGPVISSQGRIVGINYAASPMFSQYFAISRDEALGIIERLRQDEDVDSIGVNGVAVRNDDGALSGVWVSSVASGSQADIAGVMPGDVITTMEGLILATDGTMADYCDILRTHGPDATLTIEVLRYRDGQYMEGQLNGRPLETAFSFESQLSSAMTGEAGTSYSEYVSITDDFGSIIVEVPADWAEVDGSPWVDNGDVIGAGIVASANKERFFSVWDEPGLFFGASDDLAALGGYVQMLDIIRQDFLGPCELDGRYEYEGTMHRGKYDLFADCGGSDSLFLVLTAVPIQDPTEFLVLLEVQIVTDADLEAVDRILESFEVVAPLP